MEVVKCGGTPSLRTRMCHTDKAHRKYGGGTSSVQIRVCSTKECLQCGSFTTSVRRRCIFNMDTGVQCGRFTPSVRRTRISHPRRRYLLCWDIRGCAIFLGTLLLTNSWAGYQFGRKILKQGNILLRNPPNFFVEHMTKSQNQLYCFKSGKNYIFITNQILSFSLVIHNYTLFTRIICRKSA